MRCDVEYNSLRSIPTSELLGENKSRRLCLPSQNRHLYLRLQGARKTYSMENVMSRSKGYSREQLKDSSTVFIEGYVKHTIKLSMVEIYMEKVRDLFDLLQSNIQIKESKVQGLLLSGVTEITISDPEEALQSLQSGIANGAVGEIQMNMASSRSHCIYIFTVQQELANEKRVKSGKLVLVDLAGSEKVEKTGAEGRVLEEAKTINNPFQHLGMEGNSELHYCIVAH